MTERNAILSSILCVFCCNLPAFAFETLIQQSPDFPSITPGAWTSDVDATGNVGWKTYDNFRMLGGGEVSAVSWQGYYYDFQNPDNNPPSPDTTHWNIEFYSDNQGRPGGRLHQSQISAFNVSSSFTGTTNGDAAVYDYHATLPNIFTAAQDRPYWMSIQAASPTVGSFNPLWAWSSSIGDDWSTLQHPEPNGDWITRNDDRAFSLVGNRTGVLPSSGVDPAGLSALDDRMQQFMHANTIESATLGVMRNGEVVYHRGFGWKDQSHQQELPAHSMMRLASITKPITAAAIRRVADQGMLSLGDRVFDLGQPGGGILDLTPFQSLGDARLADITVLDLLRHRGGWDRSISPDYAFWDLQIADEMGLNSPPGPTNKARYLMGKPLDHEPGTRYAYSNVGFMMLGLILEEVTGQDYLDAVHEHVFDPLGVPREEVQLGRTFEANRGVREPFYDQPEAWSATNVYDPDGPSVRWPDGGWDHEGAEAYGGLVASTKALLAFGENHIAFGNNIGRVRSGNEGPNWWSAHSGSLIGTDTLLHQRGNGLTFALLFNRRPTGGPAYVNQLDDEILEVLLDPNIVWPDAVVEPGDGTGDNWVTRDDLLAVNVALHASDHDDFIQTYPDGRYLAFDLDGDGVVSGLDLPEIHELFLSYGTDFSTVEVVGDFDGDWELTHLDLEQLYANLGNTELLFDINADGSVDIADVDYWVNEIFQTLVSDANLDGVADVSDFNIWNRNRFQLDSDWMSGDFNFDGNVDVSDFNLWNRERFNSLGDAVAVPEPNAGWLVPLLGFLVAFGRSRQSSRQKCD